MGDDLRRQIQTQMRLKDTADLVAIWKKNDRSAWTDEAFDVVREILLERLGELPTQTEDDESEAASQPDKTEDTFHSFDRLARVASWATSVSWFFLGAALLLFGASLFAAYYDLTNMIGMVAEYELVQFIPALIGRFYSTLVSLFYFVMLQAVAEIIYLLLDIEDNTRPSARHSN